VKQTQNSAGPRAIASLVGKSSRAALVRRGFAQADILTHWPTIVGPNLANCSSPEKLNYSRQKNSEATLRIRVAPGWAPEFQHFEPLIIERINSFFGYRAIAKLQLIQAPIKRPEAKRERRTVPLSDVQKEWVKETIKNVSDTALKNRLEAVATSMLGARNRETKSKDHT
tara:strand:+ start:13854 stop:14363 length:510 start_codon:yes stop_codon:yes gene_type:complete